MPASQSRRRTIEVADILVDLIRRETHSFSIRFARSLVGELSTTVGLINNPHRAPGFKVLKAPDVPSVLVELGYLSNAKDEEQLHSAEWRGKAAASISNAIALFALRQKRRGRLTWVRRGHIAIGRALRVNHSRWNNFQRFETGARGCRIFPTSAYQGLTSTVRDGSGDAWLPLLLHKNPRSRIGAGMIRLLGYFFGIGTMLALLAAAGIGIFVGNLAKDLPDYEVLAKYEPPVTTRVHASDGALMGEFARERRLYLPIQAVPDRVKAAFLSAEDKNFYKHPGVDVIGLFRAAINEFPECRSGHRRSAPRRSRSRWRRTSF